ncbi:hypothetical protein ABB37_05732 [Leptomonas pyrrhocoris]|uniref:Ssl1-like domain-containing protein n=1 Tax=Leptomonas pyrrhocoris TaxID=157538 RepID=A0A0M9FZG3_LEPPY|nr:hypothetical protein ABB37_05732 [Leptomonas pyrrhocoris]KPA79255.1 hypothetical protein ABB37_05732 [Leptomonas pyrrhocoris]|eukprot:XP_015657694.1 hypothetical protein ABB37_05732 [Leptomonas pyrrhocoris]
MLRTVLLMDGSEAMNSSSDYLPSYLLAMRPPLLRLVEKYLDSTPLASLGIVVMRDGVSHRLLPCTTNRNEIVDVLERDVFLHGGSGSMSLENGLRMAMSELVDMRKVAALVAAHSSTSKVNGSAGGAAAAAAASLAASTRATWKGSATQLNVLIVSAAVTLIDPTDVFNVVNTMAALSVRINVLSLVGAVHVFDVCALETGGRLYCPMNYDHLLQIVDELATAHRAHAATAEAKRRRQRQRRGKRVRSSTSGIQDDGEDRDDEDADAPYLIPIGCPVYLKATPSPPPPPQQQQSITTAPAPSARTTATDANCSYYLACPQCHLIQLSVPTTCPLCRLLLCSAPMLYSTYVAHNYLVPAARRLRVVRGVTGVSAQQAETGEVKVLLSTGATSTAEVVETTAETPIRCALCMTHIPADAARTATTEPATVASAASEGAHVWQCSSCASYRCDACNSFVVEAIGMCPHCVALR